MLAALAARKGGLDQDRRPLRLWMEIVKGAIQKGVLKARGCPDAPFTPSTSAKRKNTPNSDLQARTRSPPDRPLIRPDRPPTSAHRFQTDPESMPNRAQIDPMSSPRQLDPRMAQDRPQIAPESPPLGPQIARRSPHSLFAL